MLCDGTERDKLVFIEEELQIDTKPKISDHRKSTNV